MKYAHVIPARFVSRPNRFVATVELGGALTTVHVKNTGRCRELLVPDAHVYLCEGQNPARKTKYDLIAVEKEVAEGRLLINMDSAAPNEVAAEWLPLSGLFSKDARFCRERFYGDSRFDFYIREGDHASYMEVKGVTLEKEKLALFPDAPTERGVKHIKELIRAKKEGFGAYLLFVIQMEGMHSLSPNRETHPAFADALKEASDAGVTLLALDCRVTPDSLTANHFVKILL